jgi:hypothetical protein
MSAPDRPDDPFFIGWLPTPRALVPFLGVVALVLAGLMAGAGYALMATQADYGEGAWAWDQGEQRLTGVLETAPYPVLRLPPDAEHPDGRTVLLTAEGKNGAQAQSDGLDGKTVDAAGFYIWRDGARILQVGGDGLKAAAEPAGLAGFRPAAEKVLGRARLTGEILDSKCYLGAMRPGQGKVHMACANLCLMGGIPPLFAVYREGAAPLLLLLADPMGRPVDAGVLDSVSLLVTLEGEVRRRGDLLIFRADLTPLEDG